MTLLADKSRLSDVVLCIYLIVTLAFYGDVRGSGAAKVLGALLFIVFFAEGISKSSLAQILRGSWWILAFFISSLFTVYQYPELASRVSSFFQVGLLIGIITFKVAAHERTLAFLSSGFIIGVMLGGAFTTGAANERFAGSFGSSVNLFGTAVGIANLLALGFIIRSYESEQSAMFKSRVFRLSIWAVVAFLGYLVMFQIGSKKALVLYLFAFIGFLRFVDRIKARKSLAVIASITLLGGGVLFERFVNSEFFYRFEDFYTYVIQGAGDGEDLSTENRLEMARCALEGWLARPFLGNGFDSFRILSRYDHYSHNNFVEVLHNFGVLGFLLFYVPQVRILSLAGKYRANLAGSDRFLLVFGLGLLWLNDLTVVSYYVKIPMILWGLLLGTYFKNRV